MHFKNTDIGRLKVKEWKNTKHATTIRKVLARLISDNKDVRAKNISRHRKVHF
jgi:hypothetical protein